MTASKTRTDEIWPVLPFDEWRETCATLQLYCQIVGKVRLALTPWINHSWHATLYVTARGLTTSLVPHGSRSFEIELDLVGGAVAIRTTDGAERRLPLVARPVAGFHDALLARLAELDLPVTIHGVPNEVPDPVPFREDHAARAFDLEQARRFWRALVQVDRMLARFRTGFVGKVSPVHLFWGSFDLAVTRFSGRRAPLHPGGVPGLPDAVTREAYSHEVSSAGFWPGGGPIAHAAFYSYAYPAPEGYDAAPVAPAGAFFHPELREFILPYDAAAGLGGWDRQALECPIGVPGVVRALAAQGDR